MKTIFDRRGLFLQNWNRVFFFSCVIATSLDALFFYIPVIDGKKKCLSLDNKLVIMASVLRSFIDIFYIFNVLFQFRTGFIVANSPREFEDRSAIARRYLASYFVIDILSILPLPQVIILVAIPKPRGPVELITKDLLKSVILLQYVPRLVRLYPLYKKATRTSGVLIQTAWAGAALNLFLYMLSSHVIGACWYFLAIEQEESCWRIACKDHKCNVHYLYCGEDRVGDYSFINSSCPLLQPNDIEDFDFGIFLDALQSHVVEMGDFQRRFLYCFWWGLRNLSSFGQNLKTSTFGGEILFAVFVSIVGLVLFSLFIGNMQKFLHSFTNRIEQLRVKSEDAEKWEQWMSKRNLPDNLRDGIKRHQEYKWQETKGVEEETLLRKLPKDIRMDVKRHLYMPYLRRVPMFENMDDQSLDAMCDRLKPGLYTENSFIAREGDPVDEMFFFMRGKLLITTTNGGTTGYFNSYCLKAGDFCGEELLTWALDPNSSSSLPISTRTVKAMKDVEAFALAGDDLKLVASQFRRLHSKQLRHTFRFYSQQWRTWAACFVQAAWCRHCRTKIEKSLREEEYSLQDALANGVGTSPSLGATIYASKFAANALRALRRNRLRSPKLPPRLPPLLLQKPSEPDFTAKDH